MKSWKPGEKAEKSGTYSLANARGKKTGLTVKVKAGDTFPPADRSGQVYMLD